MKKIFDFLPLVIFFIIYKLYDIYYASGTLIVTSTLVLFYTWLRYRKLKSFTVVIFLLATIFSALTLYYHNTDFIKWKVTVIYTLIAIVLLISQFILGKPLIQNMLDKEIYLSTQVWKNLNIAWAIFFLVCATVNFYIAFWFPQNVWVNFKVFGLTGLMLVFTLLSGIYILHHIKEDKRNTH